MERTTALSNDSEALSGTANPGGVTDCILTGHTVHPNSSISSMSTMDMASKTQVIATIESARDEIPASHSTLTISGTHHHHHSVAAESATDATLATKFSGSGQNMKTNSIPKLRIFKMDGVYRVELASGSNESDTSKSKQHKLVSGCQYSELR